MSVLERLRAHERPPAARLFIHVRSNILPERKPDVSGTGHLAGSYPDGLTTVNGVPVSATVRVLLRKPYGELGDGFVVAEVKSGEDGRWRVDGLNPSLKYDVVGRRDGFNDVISSNVSPSNPPRLSDERIRVPIGAPVDRPLATYGGIEPHTVSLKSGSLPEGVEIQDSKLVGAWPTGAEGDYPIELTVTDAAGDSTSKLVTVELVMLPVELLADRDLPKESLAGRAILPIQYSVSGGEGPYTFGVSGSLPDGLAMDTETGILSGTPTSAGNYEFTISVTDSHGAADGMFHKATISVPIELPNTNLALGKVARSNNAISLQNSSSGVTNGDTNTNNYTSFGSGEAWLEVDLGSIYNINTIKVWLYYADGRTYLDKRVQYSADGVVWISVFDDTVDAPHAETSSGLELSFAKDAARYIRVVINGSTSNGGNHAVEMQAYLIEPE